MIPLALVALLLLRFTWISGRDRGLSLGTRMAIEMLSEIDDQVEMPPSIQARIDAARDGRN